MARFTSPLYAIFFLRAKHKIAIFARAISAPKDLRYFHLIKLISAFNERRGAPLLQVRRGDVRNNTAAFGLMLVAALAGELVLAFQAGNANTRDLLADRTNLLLDSLELKVESLFQPVARQLEILGQEADEADLDPSELLRGRRSLQVMLGATSQMIGVAIVKPDLRAWRYLRGQRPMGPEDWSGSPEIRAVMAAAKEGDSVRWAAPVYSETLHQTVINAHLPVFRDGRLVAMMFAAVALETMVHYVDELSTAIGQPVFVLQGHDHVVARPGLDISTTGPDHPLPLLAEAGDAVLAAMWAGDQRPIGLLGDRLRGEAHGVASGKSAFVVLYRQIPGFGDQPWIVGTYLPSDIAEVEVQRLRHALMLSMACLLAAITATFWLGRRMARPVEQLAEAAQLIQTLELDRLQPLPRSPIVAGMDFGEALRRHPKECLEGLRQLLQLGTLATVHQVLGEQLSLPRLKGAGAGELDEAALRGRPAARIARQLSAWFPGAATCPP